MLQFIIEREPSMRDISKKTGIHYLQVITVLKQFEKEELIYPTFNNEAETKDDRGSPYIIKLTLKGRLLTKMLTDLQRLHNGILPETIIKELNKMEVKNGKIY